jgi:hypothetical protein
MLEVIRLAILNDKKDKWIEVAGAPMRVNAQQWSERTTSTVSMHLGYGEKDQAVNEMSQGYAGMAQNQSLAGMFGQPQRFAMLQDIMKLKGWTNRQNYLAQPSPQTAPQPDPLKVQEVQNKGKLADAAMINAQTNAQQNTIHSQVEGLKAHQAEQPL